MEPVPTTTSFGSSFSQVAWVVQDIKASEKFFREVKGINNFVKLENLRAQDHEGTYYGKPGDFEFHLYMAYSGESMIELIQPVAGQNIFSDYLEKNPGGGLQHIAYTVPVTQFEKAVAEMTEKGYPVITSLNLPIARVEFFDTTKEIGVVTEIIGATDAGFEFVQQVKSGAS